MHILSQALSSECGLCTAGSSFFLWCSLDWHTIPMRPALSIWWTMAEVIWVFCSAAWSLKLQSSGSACVAASCTQNPGIPCNMCYTSDWVRGSGQGFFINVWSWCSCSCALKGFSIHNIYKHWVIQGHFQLWRQKTSASGYMPTEIKYYLQV